MAADVMQPYVELREPTSLPDLVDHGPIKQDLRIATIGNVDSGKSTLVGVLTRNMLDDGAGKARATVFHHKHEKETGRSSAVSCELMVRSRARIVEMRRNIGIAAVFSDITAIVCATVLTTDRFECFQLTYVTALRIDAGFRARQAAYMQWRLESDQTETMAGDPRTF